MIRLKSIRPTLAILVAAVLIVAAGGAVVASNMGFKMNKPLVKAPSATGQTGNNWTSIPFHNPYGTIQGFCTQTGLTSTGFSVTGITTLNYNEPPFPGSISTSTALCSNQASLPCPGAGTTNSFCKCLTDADCPAAGTGSPFFCAEGPKSFPCGSGAAAAQALIPGKGLQIRQPLAAAATSIIIVGSHNSGQTLLIKKNVNYWYSVPYHTTAVTANELCAQLGLTSSGFGPAGITRLIPGPPAAPQSTFCGTAGTNFNLVLGEMIQVREPTKSTVSFAPAHY